MQLQIRLLPFARCLRRRLPCEDFVQGFAHSASLFLREAAEEITQAHAVLGVQTVVPLEQPREQFQHAGQQWQQTVIRPALIGAHALVVAGDGLSLLQLVPAGPADDGGAVGVAIAVRVGDETLLRHVQLAAQTPIWAGTAPTRSRPVPPPVP